MPLEQIWPNFMEYANVYGSDRVYCFICMRVFLWQRDGSRGVVGASCGHRPSAGRCRCPADGWMEISCYGVRRTATRIAPRAVAHRRTASPPHGRRRSRNIRLNSTDAGRQPLLRRAHPRPSLHPERHSARQLEIGKYEKAPRA